MTLDTNAGDHQRRTCVFREPLVPNARYHGVDAFLRKAPGVQGHDVGVEAFQAPGALGNDPGFERGVTVPGNVQIHRADLGKHGAVWERSVAVTVGTMTYRISGGLRITQAWDRVHPRSKARFPPDPLRQNRVHNTPSSKASTINRGKSPKPPHFPTDQSDSTPAAARRPHHVQQTRRNTLGTRHPRLENSPKPTRNPLPQPTRPPDKNMNPHPSGGGAPHPADRSHPSATVARLAIPRLRHQHQTVPCRSRRLPPGPCPSGVGHTRHQSPRRSLALPVWELLRQRRLAGLHGTCSQPLQMDRTPHQPGRTTNQREHRPHPSLLPPRQDREPRRQTDTPPTRQMAMGRHLPHHPRQHPQPPPTLLIHPEASTKTGRKHPPTGSARPYTLQIRPDTPTRPGKPRNNPTLRPKTPCAAPANPKPPTSPTHTDQNGGFKLNRGLFGWVVVGSGVNTFFS